MLMDSSHGDEVQVSERRSLMEMWPHPLCIPTSVRHRSFQSPGTIILHLQKPPPWLVCGYVHPIGLTMGSSYSIEFDVHLLIRSFSISGGLHVFFGFPERMAMYVYSIIQDIATSHWIRCIKYMPSTLQRIKTQGCCTTTYRRHFQLESNAVRYNCTELRTGSSI